MPSSDPGGAGAAPAPGGEPAGGIVLVGTPIGNLDDLSPRARSTLAGADVICCEDTRHTRKLLSHAGISGVPLVALHEHNEAAQSPRLVARAAGGETVAVVTDAGLPGVSDPGERLVAAAVAAGVPVTVVPGPTAPLVALVGSGLPTGRFAFEGFLPRKGRERADRLAAIAAEGRTTILFEAPTRLTRTLDDLEAACGPARPAALARELTKRFEERWSGTLAEAAAWVAAGEQRGEWVVMVGPAPAAPAEVSDTVLRDALARRLAAGDDRRAAVAEVAASARVPKRRVYQLALDMRAGELPRAT